MDEKEVRRLMGRTPYLDQASVYDSPAKYIGAAWPYIFAFIVALLLVLAYVFFNAAHAEPPQKGDPQSDALAPYADWIRGLTSPVNGQGCCSLSDCRLAEYRVKDGHYEAFLDNKTWYGAPDTWVLVPSEVILKRSNPTGYAVACWATWHHDPNPEIGNWFCFTPESLA